MNDDNFSWEVVLIIFLLGFVLPIILGNLMLS
jgi:hypothetical protein